MTKIKLLLLVASFSICACNKYLELKPDKTMVLPETEQDMQALLDNVNFMNAAESSLGEMAADNYYLTDNDWQSLDINDRELYIWGKDVFGTGWGSNYRTIMYANTVLETLEKNPSIDITARNRLRGSALFFRGNTLFQLAQLYMLPYDKQIAATAPGLPLKFTAAIDDPSVRSSMEKTYAQIEMDLREAAALLPKEKPLFPTRPGKAAAFAGLARLHLVMADFEQAERFADSSLMLHATLIDYNQVLNSETPFAPFNEETIFYSRFSGGGTLSQSYRKVDTTLYTMYADDDLRRTLFFREQDGHVYFKGNYDGQNTSALFNGITSAEMLLTKAECLARKGKSSEAWNVLSELLRYRYSNNNFNEVMPIGATNVLNFVLNERRKELLFRGIRWIDLRRLNKEEDLATVLTRNVLGKEYIMLPNSSRYVFLIPDDVIQQSGMEQNVR